MCRQKVLPLYLPNTAGFRSDDSKVRKEDILDAALAHVQKQGWSQDAIVKACEEKGLSVASLGMFPNGAGDLVVHFWHKCNASLDEKLTELSSKAEKPSPEDRFSQDQHHRTTEKLTAALQMRLEMVVPYLDMWPQGMAVGATPPTTIEVLQAKAAGVDLIWRHCESKTIGPTHPEYYAKRAALGVVWSATELHLLTDKSEGHQDTWDFMEGRVREMGAVGKALKDLLRNGDVGLSLFTSTIQAAQAAAERGGVQVPDEVKKVVKETNRA